MKPLHVILLAMILSLSSCNRTLLVPDSPQDGAELLQDAQSPVIQQFCQDGAGSMWMRIAQQRGLLRMDGQTAIHYTNFPDNPSSLSANMVNDIVCDRDGELWVATQKGVDRFDRETESFVHYVLDDNIAYTLRFLKDPKGDLYAQSRRALLHYNPDNKVFERVIEIPTLTRREPIPVFDSQGRLWMRTDESILRYDKDFHVDLDIPWEGALSGFVSDGANSLLLLDGTALRAIDLTTASVGSLPPALKELEGIPVRSVSVIGDRFLLFTVYNGRTLYDKVSRTLYTSFSESSPYTRILEIPEGRYFYPDSNGGLWYAFADGGYNIIRVAADSENADSELSLFLKDHPWRSSAGNGRFIWVLLNDNSLLTYNIGTKHIAGIVPLSELTGSGQVFLQIQAGRDGRLLLNGSGRTGGQTVTLTVNADGTPSLECIYSSEAALVASFDDEGGLWGAGMGSTLYYASKPEQGSNTAAFRPVDGIGPINPVSYANYVLPLRNGNILICFTDNNPQILDPRTGKVTPVPISPVDIQIYYNAVLEDSREILWFGTTDNGLLRYDRNDGSIERMDFAGDLGVGNIREDGAGNLFFLIGDRQLFRWSPVEDHPELLWNEQTGFPKVKRIFILPDNTLCLYESGRMRTFKPGDNDNAQEISGPVTITLASGRKPLARFTAGPDDAGKPIRCRIPYRHDNLNMYLSVSDGSLTPVYDYMFGINTRKGQLMESVNNSAINLYGLSGGRNVIQFKIRRTDYPAESPLYTVVLTVLRPWYFWAVQALALAAVAVMAFLLSRLQRKRREADKARQERELQEQVNMRNLDFFANISHEFRAPLTLINAAVSTLGDEDEPKEDRLHTLGIVRRNVGRMLKLVTQMLDFNKLDHDMLKLNVALSNVPDIIRRSWEIFEIGAGQKNVDFRLTGCDRDRLGFIDADKLEKIIYNLCSNALKFTPPGGRIDVDCSWEDNKLTVSVADTGIGLEEDRLDSIFERFSQTEPARKAGGTGIGLYFTKALVEMHHGHISAENRYADGDRDHTLGSVFRFSIPLSEDAYTAEEKEAPDDLAIPVDSTSTKAGTIVEHETEEPNKDLPTLLLIDDDYELVYYMKSLFSSRYNVYFRFDAMSGYNQVKEVNPDVIVCDMMMMDVDGLQFCKMVKENIEMCHIPVIMLTARSSVEDQVNSLNVGADAYVIKPFNPDYLQALVKSMVDNRNRMRQILTSSITTSSEVAEKLNIKDKQFMDKVYGNLESSLAEGEIDIDSFASRIGVSRSKFFYKIKALTGQTPGEFFTTYKLNRAAQLIVEGKYKIATVAAMVGFSSPSHFSAVFKKQFGVLPSQYEGSKQ